MKQNQTFEVHLDDDTCRFYAAIAAAAHRPLCDVLSDTLHKSAEIMRRTKNRPK